MVFTGDPNQIFDQTPAQPSPEQVGHALLKCLQLDRENGLDTEKDASEDGNNQDKGQIIFRNKSSP